MRKNFFYILFALISLLITLSVGKQIQQIITKAAPKKANIVIDTQNSTGILTYPWAAFAQGGEEPPPMLSKVTKLIRQLSPRYIRIDHIYDSYSVVKRSEHGFDYDFSKLDETVNDIISSGAVPFFSLSYMPPVFTSSGSVIDLPKDWNDWRELVKKTIEHYSGKNYRNLANVYYEVWNEPELPQFGKWGFTSEKDYRLLYFYAASGANEVSNTNNFYIGGPAVGSYYPSWVVDFLSYVSQNNLRLDFYSWHRYTKKTDEYSSDAKRIRNHLASFPKYQNIPLILSEWGLDSENSDINNSNMAASFSVAAISKFYKDINLAFAFEIKDGPPAGGGKWGLITHEKNEIKPLSLKPRFKSFEPLSKFKGNILQILGEGTFITGLATSNSTEIMVLLSNYDMKGQNTENVPITFTGLSPASYRLKYVYPLEETQGEYEIASTNGVITKSFLMPPNTLLFLQLQILSELATFIPGKNSNASGDQALVLKNHKNPLFFASPEFHLLPKGSIEFDGYFLWDKKDINSFIIFEAPFSSDESTQNTLYMKKERVDSSNYLSFGISASDKVSKVSIPFDDLTDNWHHIAANWSENGISLKLDEVQKNLETPLDIRN